MEKTTAEIKGTSAQLKKKKKTGPEPHPVFHSNRRDRLRPRFGTKVCTPHSSKPSIPPLVVEISEEEEKSKTSRRKGKEPVEQSIPLPKSHRSYIKKFIKAVKDTPILNVRPIKREGISSFINQVIDRHGWEKWLSCYRPYYPDIVKLFYANLEIDLEARTLTSSVLNIPIRISAQDLINHYSFLIPNSVITLENLKVDPSTFLDVKTILGYSPEYNPPGVKKHVARKIKHLASCSDQAKTLGRILQECFLQIHGHKDEWTHMHQTAVYHLFQGRILDTIEIIFHILENCCNVAQKSNYMQSFHYGNIIYDFLTIHHDVNLSYFVKGARYYGFSQDNFKLHQPKPSFQNVAAKPDQRAPTSPSSFSHKSAHPSTSSPFTSQFTKFIVDSIETIGELAESNSQKLLSLQAHMDTLSSFTIQIAKLASYNNEILEKLSQKVDHLAEKLIPSSSGKK
ncbi:hypothetical protein AXF42_Ash021044 [Apostasia shenzhenica]|uniref:Uncharacterized protein n=1 Tax=Apostasia shenzhenica TaxID=1088818 RepID=A0A2H9ZZA7_9ASPA|nr:hypothetical protein AXF42_Ash021044 [Apostasia shenzhenica]